MNEKEILQTQLKYARQTIDRQGKQLQHFRWLRHRQYDHTNLIQKLQNQVSALKRAVLRFRDIVSAQKRATFGSDFLKKYYAAEAVCKAAEAAKGEFTQELHNTIKRWQVL